MKRELPDELKFLTNRKAPQKPFETSMAGKLCVITGATSGVGLEAARCLAEHGASLVMISRSREKADKVKMELQDRWPVQIDSIIADLSDLDQVRQAAQTILDRCPRIDVLINCAGLHVTKRTETKAGFETVFCVNH
ncbi:MAG: SDR family NAD(P)-dependent oxidoreductase, partial [Bacillota bacterium]|nr:SDR family NAD(P)-dependent oxidoreductase [Bacillota bacterium]